MTQKYGKTPDVLSLMATIKKELKTLPSNEFSYYIAMLLASIQNESHPEQYKVLLENSQVLIHKLKQFYKHPEDAEKNIIPLTKAVNELIKASAMQTIPHSIKRALIGICGATIALFAGIACGLIGFSAGLLSNYTIIGNIKGAGLGFFAGFAIGAFTGYHSPRTLVQSAIDTKIEFCIDNLTRLRDELIDRKTHEEYQSETKNYIIDTFFQEVPADQKEEQFQKFLKEPQEYQVCTTTAGHISPSLKGHLGHHSLIRFKINGNKDIPIEFGDRGKIPNFVDQSEKARVVTGQKLFDMLVLERMLQETHESGINSALRIYDLGNDDCRTYIDKILIGTGQDPTKIGRFSDHDTLLGRRVVAPLATFFSKTRDADLHSLIDDPDDEQFDITHHQYTGPTTF